MTQTLNLPGQHEHAGEEPTARYDVAVLGAGFAGMYMLHTLRQQGWNVHVYETGDDVGGTWYWNRYPGARCDIESLYYSYSFDEEIQQTWEWSEKYAPQPELLQYAGWVADRLDLRRDISFNTTVEHAVWDEDATEWVLETNGGDVIRSRYLVTAVGCLSAARVPDFPGLEHYQGKQYHTSKWPHEGVDFTGQRVAVIGTGSSGIQSIPLIAEQASQLTVFQRTPNFSIPAHNRTLDPAEVARVKADYPSIRAELRLTAGGMIVKNPPTKAALETPEDERRQEFDSRWAEGGLTFLGGFTDTSVDETANAIAAEYVRERIRDIVKDPQTADLLSPKDYPIGAKRLCVDTGYYDTFNRDHVRLVDLRSQPIEEITATGIRAGDEEMEFDAIVFATGFDAMTGPLLKIDIRGVDGVALKDKWAAGPRTYLGVSTAGFPNLFMITGPGSPSVLSNMLVSIEQHVEWISDHLNHLRDHDLQRSEAEVPAEDDWVQHVNDVASVTLMNKAASWYRGANIPGKPRIFMPYVGGVGNYRVHCQKIADSGYQGFVHS
ncbi:flavin-containing monooxygenase [Nakamurella leprariae]|uniref:NAD(P)/FAD-dependent oxidoreductase n=1 Tax=Nakamurella leprariae TaxID=2803911 RepID=A0A938YES1_9ACTN|nr:NAD(P)/FAD-dependent oxidoreductase [Nakamurella leprariae]MBM9466428.1 NAD(P)/FAD-dependent oxidoreductase [Nakamurella leprariae]